MNRFIYVQSTGFLMQDTGSIGGNGYSGHGEGKNNTAMENVEDIGPLPRGDYDMELIKDADGNACDYEGKAAPVIRLTPRPGTNMFGRAGMLIHGDMRDPAKAGQASKGCMIQMKVIRQMVAERLPAYLSVV